MRHHQIIKYRLATLIKLFLFCLLGGLSHVGVAQKSPVGTDAVKTSALVKDSSTAKKVTGAAPAPVIRRVWRTPAMDEAMYYYTSLHYQKAQEKFRVAAAAGEYDAYYFLGRMHQYRELKYDSVEIDTVKQIQSAEKYFSANRDSAQYYYQAALDSGSVLANLGMAELMTLRNEDDMQRFLQRMRNAAITIREKAVDGDAFCNRILGSMYYTGYGEMKNHSLAFNYLRRAADANDVVAYASLANLYLNGEGVEKDKEKAAYWLQKGIEAGERESMYTMALLYEEGTLGEVKVDDARKLYRKAVAKGSMSAYEQLLYINQTPNQKVVIGALHRDPEMIKRALAAGGDANAQDQPDDYEANLQKRTPLMHALYIPMLLEDYGVEYEPEARLKAASLLIKKGADVNAQDINGKTALHYVVSSSRIRTEFYENEQVQLLDTLLVHGADPNIKDKEGNTVLSQALHATIGQHIGILELEKLLQAGANPNVVNNEGKTPLMLACEIDANYEIILALLQANADVSVTDNSGKAAIDYTKHENVQNMLLAAGSPEKQE
ncbi:ankyrin repeat domain-containing protein [Pontibacter anaerobius]|uniref:Ankyrin repeat domain-containing protein n=1 Tax=Pontibacter anaerobius TaxID=2993940 RepID=A0ABT3RIA2_9BACT|nr:ankyrin repeat domain-containing protein [Pontibacter anaerobius]MCX2741593.1 ankyrin repeat domain-containing protein [Pontibacter anaerobius]